MIKKLLLTTLFSAVALLLIVGGINRTRDRLAQVAELNGPPTNQELNGRFGNTPGEHEADVPERWITVKATVTDIRSNGLWLELADGSQARARRAAWEFAQSQGFSAQIGDALQLTGYYTNNGFEIVTMHNQATGQNVALRDENGRALWNR